MGIQALKQQKIPKRKVDVVFLLLNAAGFFGKGYGIAILDFALLELAKGFSARTYFQQDGFFPGFDDKIGLGLSGGRGERDDAFGQNAL